jgi:hypothetical protein
MLATSKIKWFGSIILAGILLVLALIGGNWGTSYSANASVAAAPIITSIRPPAVLAGSGNTIIIISGSNFGSLITPIQVRLTMLGIDRLLTPLQVLPNGISVIIPADLLTVPAVYTLTVLKSNLGTIPTIPTPPDVEISNPLPFMVYKEAFYHPIIFR